MYSEQSCGYNDSFTFFLLLDRMGIIYPGSHVDFYISTILLSVLTYLIHRFKDTKLYIMMRA